METENLSNKDHKPKIIKRYQNRKLYDTQQSCYVTLDDISKMIRADEDVMVIDNKSKNNITSATLTQIIFEAEKRASQYAPLFTLREIIQTGNGSISSYLAKLGAFPKDYMTEQVQPTPAAVFSQENGTKNGASKDAKSNGTKENGTTNGDPTSKVAAEKATSSVTSKFTEDETPNLPASSIGLNP